MCDSGQLIRRWPKEIDTICKIVRDGQGAGTFEALIGPRRKADPETHATDVPGLYAAGECVGGPHGANRLGGNSLGEALISGRRGRLTYW